MAINSPQKLVSMLVTSASDGVVSSGEVAGVLRQAGKDALTRSETKALGHELTLLKDKFEPAARTQLARYVNAASTPANTADPRVMNHDLGTVRYRAATGALYQHGVSPRDVVQGAAGDCYFLSTLGAAAKQRPGIITDAITRKDDGSYLVRFYKRGPDGKPAPVYIPVDKELPRDKWGNSRYAHSSQHGELWVSLMEKAYAKFKGSYEKIGEGGSPSDVMTALTGQPAGWRQTTDASQPATFDAMKTTLAAKGLVVASTRTGAQYRGSGVVPSHAYTVLGVELRGGTRYVTLRNPWGKTEPGAPKGGDGVFQLPMSKFTRLFPDLFMTQ